MGYKDYNTQMNIYMKNRWAKRKAAAIEKLGGKCVRCEATENLEFDHIDPKTKVMTVARASSRSEEFFWAEVAKCQLLCMGHHLIKSGEDRLAGVYKDKPKRNQYSTIV